MNKIIFTAMLIGCSGWTIAQEVVSSGGEHIKTSSGAVSYTIGEVVTTTISNSTNDITQGFHQSSWQIVSVKEVASNIDITLYPNPTSDQLNIKTTDYQSLKYVLYDISGKMLKSGNLENNITPIDVMDFATGTYTVVVINSSNEFVKSFKLIKSL